MCLFKMFSEVLHIDCTAARPLLLARQIGELTLSLAVTKSLNLSHEVVPSHMLMAPSLIIAVSTLTFLPTISLLLLGILFSPPNRGTYTRVIQTWYRSITRLCLNTTDSIVWSHECNSFSISKMLRTERTSEPHSSSGTTTKAAQWSTSSEHSAELQRNTHGLPTCGTQLSFVDIGHFVSVNSFDTRITLQLSVDGSNLFNSMIKPSVFPFLVKHCPFHRFVNT